MGSEDDDGNFRGGWFEAKHPDHLIAVHIRHRHVGDNHIRLFGNGELKPFATIEPRPGLLLMWESWLRHEVLPGTAKGDRLSISFNLA